MSECGYYAECANCEICITQPHTAGCEYCGICERALYCWNWYGYDATAYGHVDRTELGRFLKAVGLFGLMLA